MTLEDEAPGWDAITAAVDPLYPGQEPRHIGYTPGLAFGSGLQGCSVYATATHWHYVTYGLTELYQKDPEADPSVSGWGYELTMRLPRAATESVAPNWPFELLEKIARYTQSQGHSFGVGDRLDPGGPINGDPNCRLIALAFAADPTLTRMESTNGTLEFRQVFGITADELAEMKRTSTALVLDRIRSANPLLVTDPAR